MAYTLGAPKRITDEESGITFHVTSEWVRVRKIERQTREVLTKVIRAERLPEGPDRETAILEAQNEHEASEEKWLELVVGWEGVVDVGGEAVPFSAEALRQLDTPILQDLLQRLYERGKQVAEERDRKNAQ